MFAEAADWRFRQAEQGRKTLTDVSAGYASLRKTQQVMDALVRSVDPPVRGVVRESLTHLYAAEDALKEVV